MNAELKERTEDDYEAYLNEGDTVNVLGCDYNVGTLLRDIDPVRFSCGYSDWESENPVWMCSECDDEHDSESEAEDCCEEGL